MGHPAHNRIDIPNIDDIIDGYRSGTSLKQLSNESGYNRAVLLRHFAERGVPIRGRSEAEFLKWRTLKRDPTRVRQQVSAAHAARRGQVDTSATKAKRARTWRSMQVHVGCHEAPIIDAIVVTCPTLVRQLNVGPYNIDLANGEDRIAVEIMTTYRSPNTGSLRHERLKYLFDSGWALLVVHVPSRGAATDLTAIGKQCAAFVERVRRDPSTRGKYGMIGRYGEPVSRRSVDLSEWPRISNF